MSSILIARETPAASATPVAARTAVLDGLDRLESLPPLSDTAVRAMTMVHGSNHSTKDVATLIRRDAVIATAVLKLANSVVYRGRGPASDVQQAVLRIGLRECAKVICLVGVERLYAHCPPTVRWRCDILHKHALFVASLATWMNRVGCLGFTGAEYTAGLLHDIGRLIACVKAPDAAGAADPLDFLEDDDEVLARERAHLGIDHCALGYQFATKNGLPAATVRVILNHHRPFEEQFETALVPLIAVADQVANYAQRKHVIDGFDLSACRAYELLTQTWTVEREGAFRKALPTIVVSALRETRRMLKAGKKDR